MLEFGITTAQFDANHFEKDLYLQRGSLRDTALDWRQLDELLYRIEPREPVVALFRQGPVPSARYTESSSEFGTPRLRFHRARLCEQLAEGATLVINRLENHLLTARRLCAEVCRFSGQQTVSNAYLSFRGNSTFGRHWDTHDVFAIQLLGRKRWQVFAPTFALPLSQHRSDGRAQECRTTPVLDCVLETGDLLYIPRGWWHQAIPLDCASFHISVGSYAATVCDYVTWYSSRHLPDDSDARRALARAEPQAFAVLLQRLAERMLDPRTLAEFAREVQARERVQPEFDLDLQLNRNDASLTADTSVAMNGNCYRVQEGQILINGMRLGLSETTDAVLQLVNDRGSMTVGALHSQLPRLSAATLRTTLADLARQDVITILRRDSP